MTKQRTKGPSETGFHWRVGHRILYLVNGLDGTYWVFQVPLSDLGGSLIDLDSWVLPKYKRSKSSRYTREQVIEIARLAGHTEEQIEAAFLLCDSFDLTDHHDLAQLGDEEYERTLRNAKRRLAYRRKRRRELKNAKDPNN